MERFVGKSVIVTGGASGLGADITRRFIREGAKVVVADINIDAATKHVESLGPNARAFAIDVAQRDEFRDLVTFAETEFGGIDIVVNNAGVHHLFENAIDVPDHEVERMLDVNLKSVLHSAKESVPALMRRGGGSICTVASIGAVVIRPGAGPYAASKAGSIALTRSLALELAPHIRVNCVLPTSAATGLLANIPGADHDWVEARYERNRANIPMGRLCTGDDVAGAIAFLSSDDASFITGVALPVDGGRSAGGA